MGETAAPSRLRVALALGAVYLIWGSTYLAIRYGLDSIPPMLLTAFRHTTAGLLMYGYARLRGAPRPKLSSWPNAILLGTLLLAIGNGGVVFAEQSVPTGVAAILVAMVPLWVVALDWLWKKGPRPSPRVLLGVVLGVAGLAILTGSGSLTGRLDPLGVGILLFASLCWAAGSLHSRHAPLPAGPIGVGMEMLGGGAVAMVMGTLHGEWQRLDLSAITLPSALGELYLILFGSIVAFTTYVWLLKNVPPALATTYAFVNPVVAVLLGWLAFGEALSPRMVLGAAIILAALVLLTLARARPPAQATPQKSGA